MEKLQILLKVSAKFFKKYIKEYIILIIKPSVIFILSALVFAFSFINPILTIFILFISLPCMFYALWQGFLITYALNFAAYDFIKMGGQHSLKSLYLANKENNKDLALFLTYSTFISALGIILVLGVIFFLAPSILLGEFISRSTNILTGFTTVLAHIIYITAIILFAPFLNFFLQSFYFRKENERFFSLFLNCYRKIDFLGVLISSIIILLSAICSSNVLIAPLFLLANVFIYPLNMYYFMSKNNKK